MREQHDDPFRLHRFLLRHSYYSLVLASVFACLLLAGRIYLSHTWHYTHLFWNLFLAWVPYLASLWAVHLARRYPRRLWPLAAPSALWLLFLPNAAYLCTEFVHLREVPMFAPWYDIGLLLAFAWAGCSLAVISLSIMQALGARFIGHGGSWIFVVGVAGLNGLGVYLGRFRRWNSWDLLLNPHEVLADVAVRVANPLSHPQFVGVTAMFAALLLLPYLAYTWELARVRQAA